MSASTRFVERGSPVPSGDYYRFGSFTISAANRMLFRNDLVVPLTPKLFDTLFLLVRNAGNVVPKSRLLDEVWAGLFVEEGSVTQNICILRKLLAEGGLTSVIETLPKRGYRFIAKVRLENDRAEILIESPALAPSPDSMEPELPEQETHLDIDRGDSPQKTAMRRTVSFAPFRNLSRDAGSDWIGEALHDMLSMEAAFGPGADLSVGGSFLSLGGRIKVGIRVRETGTGRVLDTVTLTRKQEDLLDLIDILGSRIRTALRD
ncbi:MAG: transcriptional regulator [Acidobacteriota bacterium]